MSLNNPNTEENNVDIDWDKITVDTRNVDNEGSSARTEEDQDDNTDPDNSNTDEPGSDESANSDDEGSQNSDDSNEGGAASPQFDVTKYLSEVSEGLFTTEEDLKGSIAKIKDYDNVIAQLEQSKIEKDNVFANDYIKAINELHKSGSTKEQINEFTKLYELGDLSSLDPKEILVQDLISQGVKRSVAETMIERKYNLGLSTDADALTEEEISANLAELEISKEQMKLDSKPVLEALNEKFNSFTRSSAEAENAIIQKEAQKVAYLESLKEPAAKLATSIPPAIEVEGLKFERPEGYQAQIAQDFVEYFKHQKVSNESVQGFLKLQDAMFLDTNKEKIFESIRKDSHAKGYKAAQDELQNSTGLPRENAYVPSNADLEAINAAMDKAINS